MNKGARLDALFYSLLSYNFNCKNQVSSCHLLPSSICDVVMVFYECVGELSDEILLWACALILLWASWGSKSEG